MNKTQVVKIAKNVSIVGAFGFLMHTVASLETQRRQAEARANTFVSMFGSLATYVGDETIEAWQEQISGEEDVEDMPVEDEEIEEAEQAEASVDPVTVYTTGVDHEELYIQPADPEQTEAGVDPMDVLEPADKDVIEITEIPEKESVANGDEASG